MTIGLICGLQISDSHAAAHPDLPSVEDFPSQPIRLIVYTSPGGLIDVTARRFARLAQEYADHPFAVINRPGGGGIVAFEEALREPADGHRFLAVTRSNISKFVASGREDLIDRLHWHSYIMDNAHVLISNRAEGPGDWAELRAIGRDDGRPQRWLGVDIGGVKHVSGVKIAEATGIDMHWIPYGSGGEAVAALLGNLGTAYLGNPRDALTSDRLRIVAVAAEERLRAFPEVPTFAELGYEGLENELIWRGFAFRKGVSEDIQAWYSTLIRLVLHDPRWVTAWQHEAVNLRYRSAADFQRVVERDREEFRRYLAQLDLLPEAKQPPLARVGGPAGLAGIAGLAGLILIGGVMAWPGQRLRGRRAELVLLGSTAVIAVLALMISASLPGANAVDPIGPAGIPRLWLWLLLPLVAVQGVACLRQPPAAAEPLHTGRSWIAIAMFLSYVLLLPVLGYLLASAIYLPLLILFLGYRKPLVIGALTLAWLAFSELVFQRLLHVDLPRGVLW